MGPHVIQKMHGRWREGQWQSGKETEPCLGKAERQSRIQHVSGKFRPSEDPLPSCPAVALAWRNSQKKSYVAQALSSPPNGKLSLLRIREFAYNLAVERIKH